MMVVVVVIIISIFEPPLNIYMQQVNIPTLETIDTTKTHLLHIAQQPSLCVWLIENFTKFVCNL